MKHLRFDYRVAGLALAAAIMRTMTPAVSLAAGTLTTTNREDPGSWDPIDTFKVNWSNVATNIFDGLVYRTPDVEIVRRSPQAGKNSTMVRACAFTCVRVSPSRTANPSMPMP